MSNEIIENNLKENYLKIKECLARCGNKVLEIKDEKELLKIISSFINKNNLIKFN